MFVVVGTGKTYGIKFTLYLHSYVSRVKLWVMTLSYWPFLWWQVNCQLSFVIDDALF